MNLQDQINHLRGRISELEHFTGICEVEQPPMEHPEEEQPVQERGPFLITRIQHGTGQIQFYHCFRRGKVRWISNSKTAKRFNSRAEAERLSGSLRHPADLVSNVTVRSWDEEIL